MQVPEILDIPEKLLPCLTEFNNYRRMLLTGGRGGGKTQAIARIILWAVSRKKLRVVCGREIQSSITESVYTVFADLIDKYSLDFRILSNRIECNSTGSVIIFKGFREQGRTNIKGLEGVDILWIDEAEAITKETLDIINPTIRKPGSKIIFTMNRKTRFDSVYLDNIDRDDCLSIKINFNENKYCPQELLTEAESCRARSESDYKHIWLGEPKTISDNIIFDSGDLEACKTVEFYGNNRPLGKVLSVDIANGGGDLTVAGIIEWLSPTRFRLTNVTTWDVRNLMETTGRIQDLKYHLNPDLIVVDATGIGEGAYDRLVELNCNVVDFKGARSSESKEAYNTRAESYLRTRDLISRGYMRIEDIRVLNDLEIMTYETKSNGKKIITSKSKIKKEIQRSPDFADMLTMGVWALDKLDLSNANHQLPTGMDFNDW